MTAPDPVEQAARAKVRWWHVVVMVAGVLVFAGALVFMASGSSDRDAAAATHRRQAHALTDAKSEVRSAQAQLDDAHTEAGNVVHQMGDYVTAAQDVMTIADQQATESVTMQRLGADATTSIGDYNASITRSITLNDQYGPKIDRFRTLVGQILGVVDTPKVQNARVER